MPRCIFAFAGCGSRSAERIAVVIDGERTADGSVQGRAIATSTFHQFADCNWDTDRGAPSFVTDAPGTEMKRDPSRLEIYKDYVRNLARWLDLALLDRQFAPPRAKEQLAMAQRRVAAARSDAGTHSQERVREPRCLGVDRNGDSHRRVAGNTRGRRRSGAGDGDRRRPRS